MKEFLTFLIARSKEKSTWVGVTALLSALGVVVSPDQQEAIIACGIAVAGLISVFTAENK